VLMHNHPDPDALAGAFILRRLLQERLGLRVDLGYAGLIGRAENRAMVARLRIPLCRAREIDFDRYDAIVLIDTQPGTGNNALPAGRLPRAVFDHHPPQPLSRGVAFCDIRPEYGAVVTLVSEYLRAAGMALDRRMATAIFYAIRSETQNLERQATAADARLFTQVFPLVDNRKLARIERAPLSRAYLVILDRAFRATQVYRRLAITRLPRMPYPDVPAELADLIMRVDGIDHALVMGIYQRQVYLSLRTVGRRLNAGRVLQRIVGLCGRAGGHERMAGGRVDPAELGWTPEEVQRWLAAHARKVLGVQGVRGVPLLRRRRAAPDGEG
jgi:nanoRNase/pAp phosphatase (c-di-AMP/oligoRNAs hydrolase)